MDRAPDANHLDPVERVSPSTGENDTGEVGGEEERIYRKKNRPADKVGSLQDGEDPEKRTDTIEKSNTPAAMAQEAMPNVKFCA